ncbi:MAG: dihydropteroate synthase [Rhodoferax sp.]|uniref:dihydropteroate synthase n=1 Tax=Rhodoferax sp. TaxID=50421 RepID=UPI002606E03A|nr:dihydropteroate synthase [Rhodoferax sp.]MDD2882138.1 dihydropteroate synthase [Rhodoferax sp.]
MFWQTSRFQIDLNQPKVMGIVNVTPDSFSDGGKHDSGVTAIRRCEQLILDGADILDIGGESTRPGAQPLGQEEELARILPVVRAAVSLGVPVSVDTYKPRVMQVVLDLGADIINDIWALRWLDPLDDLSAAQVIAAHRACGVCLMHMHLQPQTMQLQPMQGDVVSQVLLFLERAAQDLKGLGVENTRILLDPGIGFGKTVAQNFALLARQTELLKAGYPLLAGWSRKSSLAGMGGRAEQDNGLSAKERLAPSLAAALLAAERGASVLRVHDVKETAQALRVLAAIR